jgi:hypothetical protein
MGGAGAGETSARNVGIDSVAVLSEVPDQPYTVLAVVSTRSSTVFDSFDDLRAALVARAALLGGDAVILRSRSTKTTPIFNTVGFVVSEQRIMVGDVIALPSR